MWRPSVRFSGWILLLGLLCGPEAEAQRPPRERAEPETPRVSAPLDLGTSVLRLLKFNGVIRDRLGQPRTGVVGLTFALYKDREGGAPLWMEVQNAELDEQGRYSVLLGSTQSEGLPLELFSSGEARWLGVQVQLPGEEEQPRVLFVSVPYALKAADAETLGGKPLSAFVLVQPEGQGVASAGANSGSSPGRVETLASGGPRTFDVTGSGTTNKVTKWLDGPNGVLGDSAIYESAGSVGIGTTSPLDTLDVRGNLRLPELGAININTTFGNPLYVRTANGVNALLIVDDASGGSYGGLQIKKSGTAVVNISAGNLSPTYFNGGNVGIGTANPQDKLDVNGNLRLPDSGAINLNMTVGNPLYLRTANGVNANLVLDDTSGGSYGGLLIKKSGTALVNISAGSLSPTYFNGGNVGIGTSSPLQKLEVAGNVKLTGTGNGIIFPDGSIQTSSCAGSFSNTRPFQANGGLLPSASGFCPDNGAANIADLVRVTKEQEVQIRELQSEVRELKARLSALLSLLGK